MSFRLLQSFGTLLLLTLMFAIATLAYKYSSNTIDYLTVVVEVHTPVSDGFNKIQTLLQTSERGLTQFQLRQELRAQELRLITRRMQDLVRSLPAQTQSKKEPSLAALIASIDLHLAWLAQMDGTVSNLQIPPKLLQDLLQVDRILARLYPRADSRLRQRLKTLSNFSVSLRNRLDAYAEQPQVSRADVVNSLQLLQAEIDNIHQVVVAAAGQHGVNSHDRESVTGPSSQDDISRRLAEDLVKLGTQSQRLIQSFIIYAEEKHRMDPGASQVVNTLELVQQLKTTLREQISQTNEYYRLYIKQEQAGLMLHSQHSKQIFIWILIVGAILGMAGVYIINRILSRDMLILIHGTTELPKSDYRHRLTGTRLQEFKELARAFNTMAEQISGKDIDLRQNMLMLDQATQEIMDAKQGLEQQVEERTRELTAAMEEARQSERAKSSFLANMSHELRTPLHGILSFAGFGMQKVGTASEQKLTKYFSQIDASGKRLKVLLDDLLDLSKLEAGKMTLNYSMASLPEVIEQCVAEQEALLDSRGIAIEYDYDKSLPLVQCDKDRMGQVVMNILSNAIKFSPDAGTISIHATQVVEEGANGLRPESVHIAIADQGIGIAEQELQSIFNKFVQSEQNEYSSGGTGLGLAITRELIHAHSGSVWAENSPAGGAVLNFLLPVRNTETDNQDAKNRLSELGSENKGS